MRQRDEQGPGRPSIVVGIDGSAGSRAALRWALRQADRIGADVEAVAVWAPAPALSLGAEWTAAVCTDADLAAATETMLLDTLVEVTREYGRSAPIRPRVVRGSPARELLRAAGTAHVLVLGAPARGTVAGLLLGSVSRRCVHGATGPVLLVPAESRDRQTTPAAHPSGLLP